MPSAQAADFGDQPAAYHGLRFWEPTATARRRCWDWRIDEGFGANVLRHEIGVLAQARLRNERARKKSSRIYRKGSSTFPFVLAR
jgi:hypothetical protein